MACASDGQCFGNGNAAIEGQGSASTYVGTARSITQCPVVRHNEHTVIDRGRPAIGVGAGQGLRTGADLGQGQGAGRVLDHAREGARSVVKAHSQRGGPGARLSHRAPARQGIDGFIEPPKVEGGAGCHVNGTGIGDILAAADCQRSGLDIRRTRVGIGMGQLQCAGADLGQSARPAHQAGIDRRTGLIDRQRIGTERDVATGCSSTGKVANCFTVRQAEHGTRVIEQCDRGGIRQGIAAGRCQAAAVDEGGARIGVVP